MMTMPYFNLVTAWLWIVVGTVSGLLLGLRFHQADWRGGYGSLPRRMYRLAHISCFGLALLNLMFFETAMRLDLSGSLVTLAGWAFVLGAFTMPACCLLMARQTRWHASFAVPVSCILAGSLTTFYLVVTS